MMPSPEDTRAKQNMAIKQVNYRNDKAVVVRVYVEKPRKKRSASIQHHHHHHYHIHHTVRQEVVHGSTSKGFDRRSRLLLYSHLLRKSTREASPTPLLSNWCPKNNLQPPTQIAPSNKEKPEYAGKVACFGSWKVMFPSLLRSWSKSQKKEKKKKKVHGGFLGNGMKILQVRTGKSFIPNLFSKTRKSA